MRTHSSGSGRFRLGMAAAGITLVLTLIATPGYPQIGAIGVVPGARGGTSALVGTPVFTNSAVVLPHGRWVVAGLVGMTRQSGEVFDPNLGANFDRRVTSTSFIATGGYALSDRALVGAMVPPVTNLEIRDEFQGQTFKESETGTGDPILFAKYQVARSRNGRTALAGTGIVSLPIGKEGFGSSGARVGLGVVASHQVGKLSLHGEGTVGIPTKDEDGKTSFGINAAGVYSISPRVWINAEALTFISDGEYTAQAAPSVRFAIGQRIFVDVGFAFKALSSIEGSSPITALAGVVFAP